MTHNAERATEVGRDMYDPEQAEALRAEKVEAQKKKGIRTCTCPVHYYAPSGGACGVDLDCPVHGRQLVLPDPRWAGLNPKEDANE